MPEKLDAAIAALNKKYGGASIGWLDDSREAMKMVVIPTGSLGLDIALGVGGVPRGMFTEIFGVESCGKTTLALHMIAKMQQMGGKAAAFIDAEHALSPDYCEALGVDMSKLLLAQPDSGEQALDTAQTLVETGEVGLIVIDSVAAMVPKAEIEGEMGDSHVGLRARLMSQACRKLTGPAKASGTALVFINQVRSSIGGFAGNVTPGGWGLKFHAAIRIQLNPARGGKLEEQGVQAARRIQATVVKNKVAPPYRKCEFDIVYGNGIVRERDILNQGLEWKMVKRSGAWYSYNDTQLGQGLANSVVFLQENPEVANGLETNLLLAAGLEA